MSQTHSYAVLRLTDVVLAGVARDNNTEGWVLVDTIDSDQSSYTVMDEWFAGRNALGDQGSQPETGRYWLVEMTPYGGNFIEFEVKQTLVLEEVKRLAEVS